MIMRYTNALYQCEVCFDYGVTIFGCVEKSSVEQWTNDAAGGLVSREMIFTPTLRI